MSKLRTAIGNRIDHLSIKQKLIVIVSAFSFSILVMACVVYFAIDTLSTVRAIVSGESLWSKGQKDALYHLTRYATTHEPAEYQKYKESLIIPLADKAARFELDHPRPDLSIVDQDFMKGGNHPTDVHKMSLFFKRFAFVPYVQKARALWTMGDEEIAAIDKIAEELHQRIDAGTITLDEEKTLFQKIEEQNVDLTRDSGRFTAVLGEAARWLKGVLLLVVFITTFFVLGFGLLVAYFVSHKILKSIEEIKLGTTRIGRGEFDKPIKITSDDELGRLAGAFNQMAIDLKETMDNVQEKTRQLLETEGKLVNSAKMAALGEMAGGIAHEINTPLATIALVTSQIEHGISTGEHMETVQPSLEVIQKTVRRINAIIQGLRTFSRGDNQTRFEPVLLKEILESTLDLCHEKFRNSHIQITIQSLDANLKVMCQPVQISQVILNMLNNSYDAIIGLSEKWIKIAAVKKEGFVEISLTDSGSGIPENVRNKVFQPFFTTKEIGKGTGLGLSISKGIIETHGGYLTIDETCKNTRLIFTLPLAPE